MLNVRRVTPVACIIILLQGCASQLSSAPGTLRVEPLMNVRHSDLANGFYTLGRHYQDRNQLEEAAAAFRDALTDEPDHIEARNALATVYAAQGKLDAAIEEFNTLLKMDPNHSHLYNNLGYVHYLKKDYRAAIVAYERAVTLDPANSRAFGNLGLAYKDMGETEKAHVASTHSSQLTMAPPRTETLPEPPSNHVGPVANVDRDAATVPSTRTFRFEIVNGTRNAELPVTLAEAFKQRGLPIATVTSLKPFTQRRTVIFYREGFQGDAERLSKHFVVHPELAAVPKGKGGGDEADVRLVLGKTALVPQLLTESGPTAEVKVKKQ